MAENQPYVEVSGVVGEVQQQVLEQMAEAEGLTAYRHLMLGVKVTHKTLMAEVSTRHGDDYYPVGAAISGALGAPGENTFAVAQVFMDPQQTGDEAYRTAFMTRLLERTTGWLQGVQFDLYPWHRHEDIYDTLGRLRETKVGGKPLKVLLQCHAEAMQDLGPQRAVRKLGELANSGCIDYVLFDASGGKGLRLDTERLRAYLEEAQGNTALQHVGLGIAGGLDARTVTEHVPVLLETCRSLSWGAEGKLHPTRDDGSRPLDLVLASEYIRSSARALQTISG